MILKRFRFNITFKIIGEVFSRLSSLIFYAMGARLLGADQFGQFSVAFSYGFIIIILVDLGTWNIVTREVARNKSAVGDIFNTLTSFKIIILPVAFILVRLLVISLGYDKNMIRLVDLMCLVALGTAFGDYLSSVLSGLEKMNVEAWLKTTWKIGTLVFAYLFFRIYQSLESFIIGMAIGQWLGVIIGFIWVYVKVSSIRFSINAETLKSVLRASFPLFLSWALIFLYDNQDIYILSGLNFANDKIGEFSASAKLVDAMRPIPVLFMGAIFPIISEASIKNKDLLIKIIKPVISHSITLLFPFMLFLSFFSRPICHVIYGPNFNLTGDVFAVATWAFIGIFVNHLLLQVLVSLDGQKTFLLGAFWVMVINAIGCYFLYKKMGIFGGAYAIVISEAFWILFNSIAVSHKLNFTWKINWDIFILPGLVGIVILLITLLGDWIYQARLLWFVIGLALYALAIKVFKLLDWNMIRRIKTL